MQRLQSLEMLRAIAALLVVLFHTQSIFGARTGVVPFGGMFAAGFRGVDLFFVLSGFIIAHVHAPDIGHPERLGNYIFNRFARIYPALWIMTLFAGGLYVTGFGSLEKAGKLAGWSIVASALLLPQIGDPLVNVTWTLKYEMFFYFVFAALILNSRVGLTLLITWQIAILAFSIWLSPEALGVTGFYLRLLCLDFVVGLVCAWLIGRPSFVAAVQEAASQWALLVFGIAAFVGGLAVETHTGLAGIPCGLGAGAIIVGLILLEQFDRIRVPGLLVLLGGGSYAIYLVHFSAITLLAIALTMIDIIPMNDLVFLGAATFGVGAGLMFDRIIDQPIQRLLRHRLKPMLLGITRVPTLNSKNSVPK